jgi:hypothetical protein
MDDVQNCKSYRIITGIELTDCNALFLILTLPEPEARQQLASKRNTRIHSKHLKLG